MFVKLDQHTQAVLAAAAADAPGGRPASTSDLLIAVLATRYSPAARVMRSMGLTTDDLRRLRPDDTESGAVVLPAGPSVTTTLAQAVRDTQLDGSPLPVDPVRLLVTMLNDPECDALRLLSAAQVPSWQLVAGLRGEQRRWLVTPDGSDVHLGPAIEGLAPTRTRSLRRLTLVQFGLVGVLGLAVQYGLVALLAAIGEGWVLLAFLLAAAVLAGLNLVLRRFTAGRLARTCTALAAGLLLLVGFALVTDLAPAGDVIATMASLGVPYLAGVGWSIRSGRRRRSSGPRRSLRQRRIESTGHHDRPAQRGR